MIEELLEKNLIRDFFEQLANRHAAGGAGARAERLGCDLERPHVVLIAAAADEQLERRLKAAVPGGARSTATPTRCGRCCRSAPAAARGCSRRCASSTGARRRSGAIGLSNPCAGAASLSRAASRRRATRWSGATVLDAAADGGRATRTSASTSTCCGWRSTRACATRSATRLTLLLAYDQRARHGAARDARAVPAAARQHQRDLGGALHPPEHAAPAPAPDRRADRDRPRAATTG